MKQKRKTTRRAKKVTIRYAAPLNKGDTIRIIAPASSFNVARLGVAVRWFEDEGFQVHTSALEYDVGGYLSGSDARRRIEFQRAWSDSKAKAIFTARGGYGSIRLFDSSGKIPFARSKKIFMGMSDISLLLNYVAKTTGMVTVHGPVLAGELFYRMKTKNREQILKQLSTSKEKELTAKKDYKVLVPGSAEGRLWGGNLSILASSVGTRFQIEPKGGFLFIEEINEPLYRLDRLFAQLSYAGMFKGIKGLIVGEISLPGKKHLKAEFLAQWVDRYLPKKTPVISGLKVGHGRMDYCIPIGGKCRLENQAKKFVLSPLCK